LSELGKASLGFQDLRDAKRWLADVLEKKR
jgi:hypothetical protein